MVSEQDYKTLTLAFYIALSKCNYLCINLQSHVLMCLLTSACNLCIFLSHLKDAKITLLYLMGAFWSTQCTELMGSWKQLRKEAKRRGETH